MAEKYSKKSIEKAKIFELTEKDVLFFGKFHRKRSEVENTFMKGCKIFFKKTNFQQKESLDKRTLDKMKKKIEDSIEQCDLDSNYLLILYKEFEPIMRDEVEENSEISEINGIAKKIKKFLKGNSQIFFDFKKIFHVFWQISLLYFSKKYKNFQGKDEDFLKGFSQKSKKPNDFFEVFEKIAVFFDLMKEFDDFLQKKERKNSIPEEESNIREKIEKTNEKKRNKDKMDEDPSEKNKDIIKEKMKKLEDKKKELKNDLRQCIRENEDTIAAKKELEEKLNKKIKGLEADLEKTSKENKNLKNSNQNLLKNYNELKENAPLKERDALILRTENVELKNEVNNLKRNAKQFEEDSNYKEKELEKSKNFIHFMKKQYIEFDEKRNQENQKTKTQILTVLSEKDKENNSLKQDLEKSKQAHWKEGQKNEAQREEITKLNGQLRNNMMMIEKLNDEKKRFDEMKNTLHEEMDKKNKEIDSLKENYNTYRNKYTKFKEEKEEEYANLKTKYDKLKKKI